MRIHIELKLLIVSIIALAGLSVANAEEGATEAHTPETHVVMLGTGTPVINPDRSGQAIAIVVGKQVYLVDFGAGLVKQFAAAQEAGFDGWPTDPAFPTFIKHAFLTHLHWDHTVGLPELLLRPWTRKRDEPMDIYGPPGTQSMVDHVLEAYTADIHERLYGSEPANTDGYKANVNEIKSPGVIYKDDLVTVKAFEVKHGSWPRGTAFGYRFETPDRVIVLSGDTSYFPDLVDHYRGADVLIHEVVSMQGLKKLPEKWQGYMLDAHTTTDQLAKIANEVQPGILVLNHALSFKTPVSSIVDEIEARYDGNSVLAEDLDVY